MNAPKIPGWNFSEVPESRAELAAWLRRRAVWFRGAFDSEELDADYANEIRTVSDNGEDPRLCVWRHLRAVILSVHSWLDHHGLSVALPDSVLEPPSLIKPDEHLSRLLTAIGDAGEAKGKRQFRKRRSQKSRPLTPIQLEAIKVVGECEGNFTKAAKQLGKDRKTVQESYNAGLAKLAKVAPKHSTTAQPTDRRGQANLVEEDDRRGI